MAVRKSSYRVVVSGNALAPASAARVLRQAVKSVLRFHSVRCAKIGIALLSDDQMSQLHQRHLGLGGPTDVLTFDARESGGAEVEGDIAVGVGAARREGRRRGHGTVAELALYAVHGVLHLLNYSDHDRKSAARMHEMEDRILESMGLGPVFKSKGLQSAPTRSRKKNRPLSKASPRTK